MIPVGPPGARTGFVSREWMQYDRKIILTGNGIVKMAQHDLKSWIEDLVIVDPVDSTRKLGELFSDIDWEALEGEQVDEVYLTAMPVLERLVGRLRLGLRQSTLPLSTEGRDQLDAILKLYRQAQLLLNLRLVHVEETGHTPESEQARVEAHVARVSWAARTILDCYVAYVDVPQPLFVDLHQLAKLAEDALSEPHAEAWKRTRRDYFAIILLALINPYALPREEMEDIFDCLQRVADRVRLVHEQPSDTSRFLDLTGKLMPHIVLTPRAGLAKSGVFVDVGALYQSAVLELLPENCHQPMRAFLERLHFYFVRRENRKPLDEKVAITQGKSLITLGFVSVHHRLEQIEKGQAKASTAMALAGLDWEGVEKPIRGRVEAMPSLRDFKMDIHADGSSEGAGWDTADIDAPMLTASGHAEIQETKYLEPEKWDLVNLSSGGYRLHWRLARDSHAAVDELILAEVLEDDGNRVSLGLGVVRWVRHLDAERRTIDMGVEKIQGRVVPAYAHDKASGESFGRSTWPVILRTDDDRKIDWVLLPLQATTNVSDLTVVLGDRNIDVRLGSMRLSGQGFAMMEAGGVAE